MKRSKVKKAFSALKRNAYSVRVEGIEDEINN